MTARLHAAYALVAALCAGFGVAFCLLAPGWSSSLYEHHFPTHRGDVGRFVLAELDAETLRRHGPWPIDRGLHARAAQNALDSGAVVVGLDVYFPDRRGADGDRQLAELARKNKQLVVAYYGAGSEPGQRMYPELAMAGPSAGHVDAITTRYPWMLATIPVRAGERSLGEVVAERYCARVPPCGPPVRQSATDMVYGATPVPMWGFNVHADAQAFARIPFHRLVEGQVPGLAGKIVLVAATHPSLNDIHLLPQGGSRTRVPGTFAVVYSAESVISGTAIFVPPLGALVVVLVLLNWGVLLLARRSATMWHIWIWLLAASLAAIHFAAFRFAHMHLPALLLGANVAALYLAAAMLRREPQTRSTRDSDFFPAETIRR